MKNAGGGYMSFTFLGGQEYKGGLFGAHQTNKNRNGGSIRELKYANQEGYSHISTAPTALSGARSIQE
jgi:hypothetical protein